MEKKDFKIKIFYFLKYCLFLKIITHEMIFIGFYIKITLLNFFFKNGEEEHIFENVKKTTKM